MSGMDNQEAFLTPKLQRVVKSFLPGFQSNVPLQQQQTISGQVYDQPAEEKVLQQLEKVFEEFQQHCVVHRQQLGKCETLESDYLETAEAWRAFLRAVSDEFILLPKHHQFPASISRLLRNLVWKAACACISSKVHGAAQNNYQATQNKETEVSEMLNVFIALNNLAQESAVVFCAAAFPLIFSRFDESNPSGLHDEFSTGGILSFLEQECSICWHAHMDSSSGWHCLPDGSHRVDSELTTKKSDGQVDGLNKPYFTANFVLQCLKQLGVWDGVKLLRDVPYALQKLGRLALSAWTALWDMQSNIAPLVAAQVYASFAQLRFILMKHDLALFSGPGAQHQTAGRLDDWAKLAQAAQLLLAQVDCQACSPSAVYVGSLPVVHNVSRSETAEWGSAESSKEQNRMLEGYQHLVSEVGLIAAELCWQSDVELQGLQWRIRQAADCLELLNSRTLVLLGGDRAALASTTLSLHSALVVLGILVAIKCKSAHTLVDLCLSWVCRIAAGVESGRASLAQSPTLAKQCGWLRGCIEAQHIKVCGANLSPDDCFSQIALLLRDALQMISSCCSTSTLSHPSSELNFQAVQQYLVNPTASNRCIAEELAGYAIARATSTEGASEQPQLLQLAWLFETASSSQGSQLIQAAKAQGLTGCIANKCPQHCKLGPLMPVLLEMQEPEPRLGAAVAGFWQHTSRASLDLVVSLCSADIKLVLLASITNCAEPTSTATAKHTFMFWSWCEALTKPEGDLARAIRTQGWMKGSDLQTCIFTASRLELTSADIQLSLPSCGVNYGIWKLAAALLYLSRGDSQKQGPIQQPGFQTLEVQNKWAILFESGAETVELESLLLYRYVQMQGGCTTETPFILERSAAFLDVPLTAQVAHRILATLAKAFHLQQTTSRKRRRGNRVDIDVSAALQLSVLLECIASQHEGSACDCQACTVRFDALEGRVQQLLQV